MKMTLSEELDLEVKEKEVTVGTETKPEELEEKAREVVNPVYANAIKQMSNMDKIRQLYSKMQEKAPEHDENPKRPTMHASAKKMRLDESLFESEYFFNDDEEGYCPSCGNSLNYEGPMFEDTETAYYNCTCPNCGKHFKEVHEIQLVFLHYEEEGLEEDLKETKCVICGGPLGKYGNNAQPVADGRCCDDCNVRKVIPARIKSIAHDKIDEDFDKKVKTNPVSWDDFYGVFQKNYKVYPSRERDGWFKLQLKTDDTGKQRGNFDRAKEICDKYNLEYRMTEGPSYKFPFMTVFEPKRG